MARINVYLPDEVAQDARAAGLNVSRLCRTAVEDALKSARQTAWLAALADLPEPETQISTQTVVNAVQEAREEFGSTVGRQQ